VYVQVRACMFVCVYVWMRVKISNLAKRSRFKYAYELRGCSIFALTNIVLLRRKWNREPLLILDGPSRKRKMCNKTSCHLNTLFCNCMYVYIVYILIYIIYIYIATQGLFQYLFLRSRLTALFPRLRIDLSNGRSNVSFVVFNFI